MHFSYEITQSTKGKFVNTPFRQKEETFLQLNTVNQNLFVESKQTKNYSYFC